MQRLNSSAELRAWRAEQRLRGVEVGFVPTMGALHAGHAALIARAAAENDRTLVSIFVNPLQFDNAEDLAKYPATLVKDIELAEECGADAVFVGRREDIYPPDFQSFIEPLGSALPLEGAHRRGHFGGVATVVLKLLCLAAPQRAYFGEKDWQQLQVITALVRDFALDVEIVPCTTVRESDGLALSSRNVRLDQLSRYQAPVIARALGAAARAYAGGLRTREALEDVMRRELATARDVEVDYAVVVNAQTLLPWNGAPEVPRACIAARLGGVRLIDNAALDADPVGALAL